MESFDRIVEVPAIIFLAIFAVVAFLIRLIFGLVKGEDTGALLPALETAALTFLGGFISRMSISIMLATGDDSVAVGLLTGWAFFFPIGVIDTIITAANDGLNVLTRPEVLLWIAASVGAFSAMMAGIWRIYAWDKLGVPAFLLDHTWGLSGTTIANLLHLVNFAWANHADEPFDRRSNNHRYKRGFALNGRFAFTQGAVMSNLSRDSSDDLWHHEHLHVWQNRIFGPLFTITYVAWMILLFIPSLIVAAVARANLGDTIMALCYYNNPWEVWAYKVGGWRNPFMAWPDAAVIIAAILFYGGVLVAVGFVLAEVY